MVLYCFHSVLFCFMLLTPKNPREKIPTIEQKGYKVNDLYLRLKTKKACRKEKHPGKPTFML